MGHALLGYSLATGGAVTDSDMTAATDPDFSISNSHYKFSEDYNLIWHAVFGATVTRTNVQVPHWNAIGRFNVWPHNLSVTIPSPPQVAWLRQAPPKIPKFEEYTVKITDTASENTVYLMGIATPDWTQNIPANMGIIPIRFTFTSSTTVFATWTGGQNITLEQSLRGGVYAVIGAQVQATNTLAFRIIFPKYRLYAGRKLRPGWLCQNTIGHLEEPSCQLNPYILGEWGRFHTSEIPQVELFAAVAGTPAVEGRLWLAYISEDWSGLSGGLGGGGMAA